jgi:hypothetical protein
MPKIAKELTPPHLRCSWGGCPAIYALTDGDLLIIGKILSTDLFVEIAPLIGNEGSMYLTYRNPVFRLRRRDRPEGVQNVPLEFASNANLCEESTHADACF